MTWVQETCHDSSWQNSSEVTLQVQCLTPLLWLHNSVHKTLPTTNRSTVLWKFDNLSILTWQVQRRRKKVSRILDLGPWHQTWPSLYMGLSIEDDILKQLNQSETYPSHADLTLCEQHRCQLMLEQLLRPAQEFNWQKWAGGLASLRGGAQNGETSTWQTVQVTISQCFPVLQF